MNANPVAWPDSAQLRSKMRVRTAAQRRDLPALIDGLAGADPVAAQESIQALMGMLPLASLYERRPDDFRVDSEIEAHIPSWLKATCAGWGLEGDFASLAVRRIAASGEAEAQRLLDRLVPFWGARRRIVALLEEAGLSAHAEAFNRRTAEVEAVQFPEQICLSPTQACQLKCSFCYSTDLPNLHRDDMTLEQSIRLLDWMHERKIDRLSFAGGEPTLFRHFPEIVRRAKGLGMQIFLTTNGLMTPAVVKALCESRPLCITLHLTEETLDGARLLELFKRNAAKFVSEGIYTILRANFMAPDANLDRYFQVAGELGIREIRAAVPVPSEQQGHDYVGAGQLERMGQLLGRFVAEGARRGIKTVLSKPFPVCMLSEDTARVLLANGSLGVNCPVHLAEFTHNMMVYPDGSFSPCLALNMKSNATIYDYPTLKDAALEYKGRVEDLTAIPMFPDQCPKCPLWQGARCVGGCLGYRAQGSAKAADSRNATAARR